jgi:bifunctional DNA-binding transcriptional regulator/antitoxin component of YhaV-PrlF toxin-antitoxin module
MSATVVREKNQTTLPADVVEAAGLKPSDKVEWRFEDGEIRGRKLVSQTEEKSRLTLAKRNGRHMLSGQISREEILAAIRADREGK